MEESGFENEFGLYICLWDYKVDCVCLHVCKPIFVSACVLVPVYA